LVPSQVSEGLERQKHLMSQETEIGGITIPGLIGRPGAEPEAPRGLPRYLFTFEAYAEALERGGVSSSEAGIPSWQRLQWNNVMPIQIPEGRSIKVMNTEGARTFEDAFPSDRRLPFMRGLKRPGFLDPFEQFVKPMQPRTVWERMGLSQEHEHDRIQAAAQLARSLGGDVLIGTNSEVRTSKDALFRQRHGEKTILTPQQLLELEHALLGEQFDLEQGDDISFLRQHLLRKNVLVSVQPGEPQLILRRELQIQQQPK